ncbi:MAG TPA: 2OG-Fe(II) oxygenase [Pirellulaceae bacterium]|nr:2OG-Fe(II) oxygenase [Pirellulaceae bacterium]
MSDFIEVYPGALNREACAGIVELFETSGQAQRGQVGSGVDTKLKDSYDITITGRQEWEPVEEVLLATAFVGLREYVRKYPFVMMGALALRIPDPTSGQIRLIDSDNVGSLTDDQLSQMISHVFRFGRINLQKYLAGSGGYPHWHSEIYPSDAQAEALHRVLLWTIYLNDVPREGETEFFYQSRKIAPCAGSLLIAPAGFTHTHRGNRAEGGDKYIATSWYLFQRAEVLYQPVR